MPLIHFCPWSQHGQANQQNTARGFLHCVHLITCGTQSPLLSFSISPPLPQSSAPSFLGMPFLWYPPTIHPEWWKLSLELPLTQVNKNLLKWDGKHSPLLLLLDLSYVAQIHCRDAPSHRRNSESQRSSISISWRWAHCERLSYRWALRVMYVEYNIILEVDDISVTYLIVSCDKLRYCVKCARPCELGLKSFQHGGLEAQLLLLMLFHRAPSLFFLLFLLHSFPNQPRYCPVIHRYICLFTLLFVDAVVLTNMSMAWQVTPFVESLALSMRHNKLLVIPVWQ